MKKTLILGGALTAIVAVAAFAQMPPPDAPPGPPMAMTRTELQAKIAEHFKAADANHDGIVTKAEFDAARAAMKAKMEAMRKEHRDKMFAMLDKDGNGSISKAEFDAAPPPGGPDGDGPGDHDGPGGPRGPEGHGPDGDDGPHGGHGGHGHGDHMRGHHGMMGMMMGGDHWFDRADANHDGKLTLAEASAGPLAMFDKADTNHDGTISPAERKAAFEAMRGHKPE